MKNKILFLFCMCVIFFISFIIYNQKINKDIINSSTNTTTEFIYESQNTDLNNEISGIETSYEEQEEYEEYDVPYNSFKSYMPYKIGDKSIFYKSSKQYKLQEFAYSTEAGLRKVDGHYCVAIGTGYKDIKIGDYAEAVLENKTVIPIIIGDIKADAHTDSTNKITKHDNSAIEFIVDMNNLAKYAKQMGDISYLTENYKSKVIKFRFYNKNYFDEQLEEINEEN